MGIFCLPSLPSRLFSPKTAVRHSQRNASDRPFDFAVSSSPLCAAFLVSCFDRVAWPCTRLGRDWRLSSCLFIVPSLFDVRIFLARLSSCYFAWSLEFMPYFLTYKLHFFFFFATLFIWLCDLYAFFKHGLLTLQGVSCVDIPMAAATLCWSYESVTWTKVWPIQKFDLYKSVIYIQTFSWRLHFREVRL